MIPSSMRFFVPLVCVALPYALQAQNPYDGDARAVRAGAVLYRAQCAECHGPEAQGVLGPNLTRLWVSGMDDQGVFQTIRRGIPNSVMPASSASDDQIWAIAAYLKSLGTVPPWEQERGDVTRGRELFSSMCANCHLVNGRGGRLGPDLSGIAQTRSRDAVVTAIRDPDAAVSVGYRTVTLVTEEGERVRGAIKSEDAFSIQIMDTNERLQGYLKAELREVIHEERPLMPPFGTDRLSDQDLEDLLRYLGSL